MRDELDAVLQFVDGHVKFAEAKNTGLLTANVLAIVGAIAVLTSNDLHSEWLLRYLRELVACCVSSAALSLLSFLPRTEIPWLRKKGNPNPAEDDLLFFGAISRYRPDAYLKALASASGESAAPSGRLHELYARQIVINARIADQKFAYFRYAIWLTLAGAVTAPLALIIYFVLHDQDDF
jgi:Pycsar effector protein